MLNYSNNQRKIRYNKMIIKRKIKIYNNKQSNYNNNLMKKKIRITKL